jgi:glycosyltransferase involved in cell wall biosynthesis
VSDRPRVLFVSRERHRLPLSPEQRRKWDALADVLDLRVLAASADGSRGDERFVLEPRRKLLDGPRFYATLPVRVAREVRRFRPDALLVQGVHEAALVRLARTNVPLILDVHGDWRTAARLYGSPARRLLAPAADALAPIAIRGADAVRTISGMTSRLVREQGVEPTAEFPAYVDVDVFCARPAEPLPETPAALFVGVLERYKGVETLLAAWPHVPDATLRVVGTGRLQPLLEAAPARVTWTPRLDAEDVARALDESTLLVLPSPAEGLGRVVIEAFCRGRPVVGGRGGGLPDIVEDGVNGLLVEPGDPQALAAALRRVLEDRELAERLAAGAAASARRWTATPEEFAGRIADLVRSTLERCASSSSSR